MLKKDSSFQRRLKECLEDKGIRQQRLADATGIEKSQVSKYLRGVIDPKIEIVVKIAYYLNVNPLWLSGFNVPKKEDVNTVLKKETYKALENLTNNELKEALRYIAFIVSLREDKK